MAKKHTNHKTKVTVSTVSNIKDFETNANQGIILVNQKTMQEIYKKSGEHAKNNEFQTHFWALNFRYKGEDGSILDIAIPTVHFNYEQTVNPSAVDFDLKDVSAVSEKLKPVHNMMVNQLQQLDVQKRFEEVLGVELEVWDLPLNSIHRHPGSLHSFSGTDLCKTPSEPGVVYPLAKPIDDQPNFAGIMTLHSDVCKVGHYEYRTAKGELGTDIEYTKGRCAAIMIGPDTQLSLVEQIIGVKKASTSYGKFDNCEKNEVTTALYDIMSDVYLNSEFSAFTDSVVPSNVKKTAVTVRTYTSTTVYDKTKEYELYNHKFLSDDELKDLYLYKLNEAYKKLIYLKTGSMDTAYVSSTTKLIDDIKNLQKELGYTKEKPFGEKEFVLGSIDDYNQLYAHDLSLIYDTMCDYFKIKNTRKGIVKTDIINAIKEILKVHKKDEIVSSTTSSIDYSKLNLKAFNTKDTAAVNKNLKTLETYKDYIPMDFTNVVQISKKALIDHLKALNTLYYNGSSKFIDNYDYSSSKVDDLIVEIEETQEWIEEEIDHAKKSVNKIVNSYDLDFSDASDEPSIQDMKDELLALGTTSYLINTADDEGIKKLYNRIIHKQG